MRAASTTPTVGSSRRSNGSSHCMPPPRPARIRWPLAIITTAEVRRTGDITDAVLEHLIRDAQAALEEGHWPTASNVVLGSRLERDMPISFSYRRRKQGFAFRDDDDADKQSSWPMGPTAA